MAGDERRTDGRPDAGGTSRSGEGEDGQSRGGQGQGGGKGESGRTVLLALLANGLIAVGKFVVGASTGSAAMLSEGAHSVADTLNEGFLLAALKRSQRKPDVQHPFGYGKERFFWSLVAAVGIFVAGAGFSFLEAYEAFTTKGGEKESFVGAYVMLGVAFVLESVSWARAVWQTRREARDHGKGVVEHVRESSDPTVKTVASEDTAALVGLALAFAGLLLHELTGAAWWEGIASLLIGLVLVFVAYALARDSKGLLIGEAADDETRARICELLQGYEGVEDIVDVLTMTIGTDRLLVAVRLAFSPRLDADQVEELSTRIDRDLHDRVPEVYQVFLDATRRDADRRVQDPVGPGQPG